LWVALIYWTQYIVESIEMSNQDMFVVWVRILLGIAIIAFVTKIIRKPYIFRFFSDSRSSLNTICLPALIHGDNNVYERIWTGKLMDIYNKWKHSRSMMAMEIFSNLMSSLILFVAFLTTVYTKDIWLFRAAIVVLVIIGIWLYNTSHISYKRRKKNKTITTQLSRLSTRWFMSKFEIMQQNKVDHELQKNYDLNNAWYATVRKEKIYQWLSYDWAILFATLLFVGLVYSTWQQVFNWELLFSDLVIIIWLGTAFIRDLWQLATRIRLWIIDQRVHIEKLRDLLDKLEIKTSDIWTERFLHKKWDISLQHVDYGYNEKTKVLSDFSMTIQWWKKVALVWLSWSWKSTIIKLIAWYLTPDSWWVFVDSQNIQTLSLSSYYKHIWYLTQDPSIFDWTIRENLLYWVSENTSSEEFQKQLDTALQLAKCEFVYDFELWVDTEIGERGVLLSWGQRQRLAIAKVFIKNPEIILLDEPTSALDSFSEDSITQAMNNLFVWRTVIIIAHRLQTVKESDEIIVLEAGKIIERGTHTGLIATWWSYNKMLELQSWF